MKNNFQFFNNHDCAYFPCHETSQPDQFNCKFCYCPLYLLDCGGHFKMNQNIKDCSECKIPHKVNADDYINKVLKDQVFNR